MQGRHFYLEVDSDRGNEITTQKRVVLEANEQTRLANARVANEHYLDIISRTTR